MIFSMKEHRFFHNQSPCPNPSAIAISWRAGAGFAIKIHFLRSNPGPMAPKAIGDALKPRGRLKLNPNGLRTIPPIRSW